jgi:serine/threonine protein kinase
MIGKTISHYKIIEKLGAGGMGTVYKAEDTKLHRIVALKFLSSLLTYNVEAKERFIREAQAAAALNHKNICTIHDIGEWEDQLFIIMEYIKGQNLDNKLKSDPFSVDQTIQTGIQICQGLQEAHKHGIVHRDIKSSNIMISENGQVKIMDFGLARSLKQTRLTKEGSSSGTVAYMSFEQASGQEVDHRTDIWSSGVVMYEMLTGKLPFPGDVDQVVIYSILNKEPEPVTGVRTDVPIELERIINKAMSKNPEERYQHINEIQADLGAVEKGAFIEIQPEESGPIVEVYKKDKPFQITRRKKRNRKITFLITAVATAALLALIIFIIQQQRSTYIANRIVVVPFENKTGDESLEMLGQMAAEMITQGMSQISEIETMPFISVMDSYSKKKEKSSVLMIAEQNNAGVLITGSYYLQGEMLFFRGSIMDAEQEKLIEELSPIKGSSKTQDEIIGRLCSQVLGALAYYFKYDVQAGQTYIPSFEAYKEFQTGRELFGTDYDKARSHFYKSAELDSAFTIPLLYIAVSYNNQDQNARADSIFDILNEHRETLPLFDCILLDYFIAVNSGNRVKAMSFLRKAEKLAPGNYLIKFFIGINARCQNFPQLVVKTYAAFGYERMAEEIRGSWGLRDLANALYMLGEYDEALDVIHFSHQHFPDHSYNLRLEAILHAARGHLQEVDKVIDESFQLTGSAPGSVMFDAAKALRAHGYKEVAHEVLRRALEWYNSRTTGDYRYSIAEVLYCDEQWLEAQQYFEQLYREYPDNQNYYGYSGVVAARLGEREKATIILEELYSKDEPYLFGSHLYWCARIAAVLGEHQRAVDLLREAYGQGECYGIDKLLQIDFESLCDYHPYIELMRPKG